MWFRCWVFGLKEMRVWSKCVHWLLAVHTYSPHKRDARQFLSPNLGIRMYVQLSTTLGNVIHQHLPCETRWKGDTQNQRRLSQRRVFYLAYIGMAVRLPVDQTGPLCLYCTHMHWAYIYICSLQTALKKGFVSTVTHVQCWLRSFGHFPKTAPKIPFWPLALNAFFQVVPTPWLPPGSPRLPLDALQTKLAGTEWIPTLPNSSRN